MVGGENSHKLVPSFIPSIYRLLFLSIRFSFSAVLSFIYLLPWESEVLIRTGVGGLVQESTVLSFASLDGWLRRRSYIVQSQAVGFLYRWAR